MQIFVFPEPLLDTAFILNLCMLLIFVMIRKEARTHILSFSILVFIDLYVRDNFCMSFKNTLPVFTMYAQVKSFHLKGLFGLAVKDISDKRSIH